MAHVEVGFNLGLVSVVMSSSENVLSVYMVAAHTMAHMHDSTAALRMGIGCCIGFILVLIKDPCPVA